MENALKSISWSNIKINRTIQLIKNNQRIIAISTCARANPNSIAMRYLQRKAIMMDPNWSNGFYYNKNYPLNGIRLARYLIVRSETLLNILSSYLEKQQL